MAIEIYRFLVLALFTVFCFLVRGGVSDCVHSLGHSFSFHTLLHRTVRAFLFLALPAWGAQLAHYQHFANFLLSH